MPGGGGDIAATPLTRASTAAARIVTRVAPATAFLLLGCQWPLAGELVSAYPGLPVTHTTPRHVFSACSSATTRCARCAVRARSTRPRSWSAWFHIVAVAPASTNQVRVLPSLRGNRLAKFQIAHCLLTVDVAGQGTYDAGLSIERAGLWAMISVLRARVKAWWTRLSLAARSGEADNVARLAVTGLVVSCYGALTSRLVPG